MNVAIAHDYLTQRGGAERVVLAMADAFPGAPIYTSLYDPDATFPEFADLEIRTGPLNRSGFLRRHHRAALPFLAKAWDETPIDADVVVVSSSGWAHGAPTSGRKIVYCHTPARWLYLPHDYVDGPLAGMALSMLGSRLKVWDRAAAATADAYVANSTVVQKRIHDVYGIEASLIHPPHSVDVAANRRPVDGVDPGYFLAVSRLISYKNVDAVVAAMRDVPGHRLVVVGAGPQATQLQAGAPSNVTFTGVVDDAQLRWLYANADALVSASYEDFGLTPIEAAAFGVPAVTLGRGGFLDTVAPGTTGVFFDEPRPELIAKGLLEATEMPWDVAELTAHADRFSVASFATQLQQLVTG